MPSPYLLSPFLLIVSLLTVPTLAKPLQALSLLPSSSSSSPLPLFPQLINLTTTTTFAPSFVNSSSPSSTEPEAENALMEIACNGEHFGRNPNIADCQSAVGYISPDSEQYEWGPRHKGLGAEVFPLPFRIMGDRALCFFQTVLVRPEKNTARASLGQVRRAASALILQCAADPTGESRGGMASLIGGDNNLAVVMGIYEPNVQCRGTFGPEWSSCRDILGDMPVGNQRVVFGPRGKPGVQQGLPVAVDSSDDKCILQLFSNGQSDTSTWYRMWEATTAVFSVCVRAGRGGSFKGLGDLGNIFLTLSPARTDAGVQSE